jgi:hypothetical protein
MSAEQQQQGRPPYPPFTAETAQVKVKAAQDAWNTKQVVLLLSPHHRSGPRDGGPIETILGYNINFETRNNTKTHLRCGNETRACNV